MSDKQSERDRDSRYVNKPRGGSAFSEFIRNASIAEKDQVFNEVMKKAIEQQNKTRGKA